MRRKKIGTMDFHGSVDITDPCYDRDVWCRMADVKIRNGVYTYEWAERSPQLKSDFYKEDIGMNPHKKNIELTGSLIYPIEVGEAAFIREADGMRMTSTVLRTKKISAQEICFETVNTNYHLHVKQEVSA